MHVAICGGGVIGAAAAYELARRGADVTLIERWKVGGCASGKSGGFLARDWCDGTPVEALAQRSFDLHEIWAERLGNPYGYRKVDTFGAALRGGGRGAGSGAPEMAAWLSPHATHRQQLGDQSTTAQLDPALFTNALADAAVRHGATLKIATVDGAEPADAGGNLVVLEGGETVEADAVILALGPWSLLAAQWVQLPPVYGLKGHSIVFAPEASQSPIPAEAIFAEVVHDGDVHTPEIVSRADGTVYVCGLPGQGGLPVDPSQVLPEEGGCDRLRDITIELVPQLKDASVIAEQACYRPVTADGMPLIGEIPGRDGVYVASGHSVWGMLNAPGTAEALAQHLLDDGDTQIDLTPFRPDRLAPMSPDDLQFQSRT